MRLDKTSKIYDNDKYIREKNKFYFIDFIRVNSPEMLAYSDEKNYVIARGGRGYPAWIWTVDGISESKMSEVAEIIAECFLTEGEKSKFTAKKEFYDFLKKVNYPYLNQEDYFEMGTLECKEVKEPNICEGSMDKPKAEELNVLANYLYMGNHEMDRVASISEEKAHEDIKAMLDSETLFVWRNNAGKIVCMVNYKIIGKQVKLGHVYTPNEERCKGYATNLIYHVTKLFLELQLEPLLYTEYHYKASNKAYQNAGYEDTGILINFACNKKV